MTSYGLPGTSNDESNVCQVLTQTRITSTTCLSALQNYGKLCGLTIPIELFDGGGIFGPKEVYDSKALKGMLKDFDRRAGTDNATWLRQYATGPDGKVKDSVNWPNDLLKGFTVKSDGTIIKSRSKIPVGTFIDRFGKDSGSACFAPFGTPFASRAIPANVLFLSYNAYEFVKALGIDQGLIAPGFGQPRAGHGIQYIVPPKKTKGPNGKDVEVVQSPSMLTPEYLKRLTTKEIEDLYQQLFSDDTER